MPQLLIRKAEIEDLVQIIHINDQLNAKKWPHENFNEIFKYEQPFWVVANSAGVIAGFIIYSLWVDEVKIINLTVGELYRNQGLGSRLMWHAVTEARQHKVNFAMLNVRVDNHEAIHMYTKLGFKTLCIRPKYYYDTDHQDSYLMQLSLAPGL